MNIDDYEIAFDPTLFREVTGYSQVLVTEVF